MEDFAQLVFDGWAFGASKRSKLIFFTHTFFRLLDADFVLFGLWIITQTRTGVVTLGLLQKTDGYLTKCDAFLLFSSNTWPVKSFHVGLGAYPWRTETDATDLDIYRGPWQLETHLLRYLFGILLWYKDDAQNVSKHDLWSSPVFFSKTNCGQKKRGSWAQKGEWSYRILFHICFVFSLMSYFWCNAWILNIMCSFQTMKPLMEKRRRARINDSLDHLKNLILPLTGRDVSYYMHFNTYRTLFRYNKSKATFRFTCLTLDFLLFSPEDSLLQTGESRHPRNDCEVPQRHSPRDQQKWVLVLPD